MRTVIPVLLALALGGGAFAAKSPKVPVSPEVQRTFDQVRKTFGSVPGFFKVLPQSAVEGVWDELKNFDMAETSIPAKYKSLISLGIASQIPCRYCVIWDTEAARLGGATDLEIQEAVTLAAVVRKWSTVLNGLQTDEAEFRKEMGPLFSKEKKEGTPEMATLPTGPAEATYKDIHQTLGMLPSFLRNYPEEAVGGAWKVMKAVQLNPNSAIPSKYKELIGLGISSQIPCKYCTYFHTEAAKFNGATEREVREAVAIASVTRFWSTALFGMQVDERVFRKEAMDVMKNLKRAMSKTAQMEGERTSASSPDEDSSRN